VVTLAQLGDLGLGPRGVSHRLSTGRLRRMHRGVYAVDRPTTEARWMAAVLAVGGGAVLSHGSAAALWGLCGERRAVTDVTLPGQRTRRRHSTIEIHSGSALTTDDLTTCDGIPCTGVPRTLLDIATIVDRRSLERAIDRAEELRVFDLNAIEALLTQSRRRRGAALLAAALSGYEGPTITRSEAEERFLAVARRAGIPAPEVNAWIALDEGGYSPDFLWRDLRLIVEIDGRTHHSRRRAFRHDRVRDRRLALAGYETRRYDASEVLTDAKRVERELKAFLAARRP
jgi:hypothetical protein